LFVLVCAREWRWFDVADVMPTESNAYLLMLQVLKELGLLTSEEFEEVIVTEYDPVRVGLEGGKDIWVEGCLNVGVHPKRMLEIVRGKFLAAGGVIYEHTAFKTGELHPDGVLVKLMCAKETPGDVGDTNRPTAMGDRKGTGDCAETAAQSAVGKVMRGGGGAADSSSSSSGGGNGRMSVGAAAAAPKAAAPPKQLRCRLLLDCMGHYSPIVKQLRGKTKPEGMVLVVGSCAEGG
jgi:lycopene cyclase CruP